MGSSIIFARHPKADYPQNCIEGCKFNSHHHLVSFATSYPVLRITSPKPDEDTVDEVIDISQAEIKAEFVPGFYRNMLHYYFYLIIMTSNWVYHFTQLTKNTREQEKFISTISEDLHTPNLVPLADVEKYHVQAEEFNRWQLGVSIITVIIFFLYSISMVITFIHLNLTLDFGLSIFLIVTVLVWSGIIAKIKGSKEY